MPFALGRLVPRLARRTRTTRATGPARANARRAVLWALAVAALATFAFSVLLETAAPTLRDPEHGVRMTALRDLRAKSERPLVVFIGSSWTQNAIDPDAMNLGDAPGAPRAYNYGLGGALPPYLPVVARRLWDADIRPAAVVVEVFPTLLCFDDTHYTKFATSGAGLTLLDVIRLTPATTRHDVHKRWLEARLVPWYAYRHQLVGSVDARWLTWEARALVALPGRPRPGSCPTRIRPTG